MTAEMLYERYRKAKDPVERTHWHMLWQVKEGKSPQEVGSGVWLHPWMGTQDCEAARMHQEKQGSPTIVVTYLEPNRCSQQSSNVSCSSLAAPTS